VKNKLKEDKDGVKKKKKDAKDKDNKKKKEVKSDPTVKETSKKKDGDSFKGIKDAKTKEKTKQIGNANKNKK
jgi:hypothetical protein